MSEPDESLRDPAVPAEPTAMKGPEDPQEEGESPASNGDGAKAEEASGKPEPEVAEGAEERIGSPVEAAPPPPPKKKTPAEAFAELTETVFRMQSDFSIAMEGVRASHALVQRVDRERLLAERASVDALVRVHGLAFKHVQASKKADPNSFGQTLLQVLEGEFQNLGIEIIRPQRGDSVDYGVMDAIGRAPCGFWQKPGRIAEVEQCGFALKTSDGFRILHKAKVVVLSRDVQEETGE